MKKREKYSENFLMFDLLLSISFVEICWNWGHVDLTVRNTVLLDIRWKYDNQSAIIFFISVHIEPIKLLKRFAFSQKSEIKLPSTSKGGIAGIFLL